MGIICTRDVVVTVALGLALGTLSPANADDYSFITIAVTGASATFARGINDAGDVVGQFSMPGQSAIHGFLYSRGRFITFDYPGAIVTVARGINNVGQIVGEFYMPGGAKHLGFRRDPDGTFDGDRRPGSTYTNAVGINTGGQIAGWFTDTAAYHGFLLSGGDFTTIDVLGAASMGILGINDSGQMVGWVNDGMSGHGLLVSGGTPTTFDAGVATVARGINNAGEIVGTSQDGGFVRDTSGAFETIVYPGFPYAEFDGINNSGQVVGWNGIIGFLGTPTDVELIIEPGVRYDTWLPEGSLSEDDPGDLPLTIRAVLQHKGGGPPSVQATTMTFRLTGVSHEPGVAMNYPRYPHEPAGPDLEFAPAPSGIVADDGQSMELVPGAYTEVLATIAAFDFGAYGVLEVTATTEDGQQLVGHLEGQEDKTALVIPKHVENSFIADNWKGFYGAAAGSDDADVDDQPAGSGKNGDYLTAYEEYRGVFEVIDPAALDGIRHVRTDPRNKDVFIRDLDGIGLDYFTTENLGAPVHVLSRELWDADRVVNYNHATAHVNDQRGIRVTIGESPRSDAFGETAAVGGREPFIPNRIVRCEVWARNIERDYATLTRDVGATDNVIPYRLIRGGLYRQTDGPGSSRPAGAVRLGGAEEIDYTQSAFLAGEWRFATPPRTAGTAHARGTVISAFINEADVMQKVLAHEAGHAVGLDHFWNCPPPSGDCLCDGIGTNVMSVPMCAGALSYHGYWPRFVGDIDSRAGEFEVVE